MNLRLFGLALAAFCCLAARANAALDINLNYYFGDGVTPGPGALAFKLRLEDSTDVGSGLTANQVRLTIVQNNLVGSEFLKDKGFYLNVTTAKIAGTTMTYSVDPGDSFIAALSTGDNAFKADGDGLFDLLIGFDQTSTLGAGDTGSFVFTHLGGLAVSDFQLLSAPDGPKAEGVPKDGFLAATHVQSTTRSTEGSVWIGDTGLPGPTVIAGLPEPTSLAIWALGMVVAGFGARRLRRRA